MVQAPVSGRDDKADARALRDAAGILLIRAKRQTLGLRVVVMFLEHAARRIDKPGPLGS
jgi:hypothetical protein